VKTEDGREHAVVVSDSHLAVRQGNRVSLIWGIKQGKDQGPYVGIYNHDTRALSTVENQFKKLVGPRPFKVQWIVTYVVLIILCWTPMAAVGYLGLFVGLPVLAGVRYFMRHRALKAEVAVVAQGLAAPPPS
jgi:hypothetical protein